MSNPLRIKMASQVFDQAMDRLKSEIKMAQEGTGPVWEAMGASVIDLDLKQNASAFANQGETTGPRWKDLMPETRAAKRAAMRRGGDDAPTSMNVLVWSGRLRDSLSHGNHPDRVQKVTKGKLVMGTLVPYAKFHQEGTKRMVARPPVRKTDAQRLQITQTMAKILILRLNDIMGGQLLKSTGLRKSVAALGRRGGA